MVTFWGLFTDFVNGLGMLSPDILKIDALLGCYDPDWAVLAEVDGQQRLYFVVKFKSTLLTDVLRPVEQAKIDCDRERFKALGTEVRFKVAPDYRMLTEHFTE